MLFSLFLRMVQRQQPKIFTFVVLVRHFDAYRFDVQLFGSYHDAVAVSEIGFGIKSFGKSESFIRQFQPLYAVEGINANAILFRIVGNHIPALFEDLDAIGSAGKVDGWL